MLNAIIAVGLLVTGPQVQASQRVLVVVGASGTPEYAARFDEWVQRWKLASERASADFTLIGRDESDETDDRRRLQQWLAAESEAEPSMLWIVLIGHGTYDGRQSKFNLRGPDVTAEELAQWLGPIGGTVAVINCASASAPFINRLSGENRIILTATKSGYEFNYARFGRYISETITDPRADLDKDGQVSLLEAFLAASSRVKEFYAQESRLATEQALIDDNGDALGTPSAWFRGIRAVKRAKDGASLDGLRAHQLHLITSDQQKRLSPELIERRNELETKIETLREQKGSLSEDDYYGRLEKLMLELARLYRPAHLEIP